MCACLSVCVPYFRKAAGASGGNRIKIIRFVSIFDLCEATGTRPKPGNSVNVWAKETERE